MISCFIWSRSEYNFILWQILLTHSLKALPGIFLIRWSVLIKFQMKRCDEFLLWNYRHKDEALESSNRCCCLRFAENNFKVPLWALRPSFMFTLDSTKVPLHRPWFIIILVCYPGPWCRHSAWNKLTFSHLSSDWPPFVQKRLEQLVTGLLPQASLTKSHTFCSPVFVITLRRGSSRVQHVAQGCFDM